MSEKLVSFDFDKALETIPAILYKYRVWDEATKEQFHTKVLTERHVFLPSPKMFNDPFDAALPLKYDERELTPDNVFNKLLIEGRAKWPEIKDSELHQRAYAEQSSGRFENGDYWKERYEQQKEQNAKTFGVLSLTSKRDNLLMWSHYSDSHKGFVVGFDAKLLYSHISGTITPVHYEREFPNAPLFGDIAGSMLKTLITKSKDWEYEDEYRIVKFDGAGKLFNVPDKTLREVILGFKMSDKVKSWIIDYVKENLPQTKIFESRMSQTSFRLDIVPIL